MIVLQKILILFLLTFMHADIYADEIRPGYLQLNEIDDHVFLVTWKVPKKNNKTLLLVPDFSDTCKNKTQIISREVNNAILQSWFLKCDDKIYGQRISVSGIASSSTDVLLRLNWKNGNVSTVLLNPAMPYFIIPEKSTVMDLAMSYFVLGAEHILMGVDHLLFVFALLLLVNNTRRLVMTVTAFTLAHSITLAAATLGWVYVPQRLVEALIALSILFLAVELIHAQQGREGVAKKWPWLISFMFGLLHGFGFAGALAEIGLPEQAIPLTLLFFNIGVETGQLFFVLLVLMLGYGLSYFNFSKLMLHGRTWVIYFIGSISAFWLFERMSAF